MKHAAIRLFGPVGAALLTGALTHADMAVAEGLRDYLIGKVQECCGVAREEADKQLSEFEREQ